MSGHVQAFAYFGGVPSRISYDNVATAVKVRYEGEEGKRERKREESQTFVSFRSYYLFASHFCTPGFNHSAKKQSESLQEAISSYKMVVRIPLSEDHLW